MWANQEQIIKTKEVLFVYECIWAPISPYRSHRCDWVKQRGHSDIDQCHVREQERPWILIVRMQDYASLVLLADIVKRLLNEWTSICLVSFLVWLELGNRSNLEFSETLTANNNCKQLFKWCFFVDLISFDPAWPDGTSGNMRYSCVSVFWNWITAVYHRNETCGHDMHCSKVNRSATSVLG